ncbi:polypeptide N-acetylgalactosaminyltransferase 5-like [Lineus longissimus]|uniref:polypeptide N-acetylgalactosaminyltransferase 5-like n=1 Tax=Lineus longissimus TaxID=88925 RepID=UPI002B4F174C
MRIRFSQRQIYRLYILVSVVIGVLFIFLFHLRRQPDKAVYHGPVDTAMSPPRQVGEKGKMVEPPKAPRPAHKFVVDHKKLGKAAMHEYNDGYENTGFNKYASDRIPLDRDIPDTRSLKCASTPFYDESAILFYPSLGVAIPLRNEPRSTLLRTVHSILNRTRPSLLKEIVLLDDFSDSEETVSALKEAEKMSPKITVLRNGARLGLHLSRLQAILKVTADVVFTTDAHVEVGYGWAEPLLFFLQKTRQPQAVYSPTLDIIDKDTFEYFGTQPVKPTYVIGIDFFLDTLPLWNTPEQQRHFDRSYAPIQEPAVGTHFAMRTEFYGKIGGISMNRMAGADVEISFKAWLCGDGIFRNPCSRVGHIDRDPVLSQDADSMISPEEVIQEKSSLAKYWMEDYAHFVCSRFKPHLCRDVPVHSDMTLSDRKSCQAFKSYLTNAAFMIFIPFPNDLQAQGQIVNNAQGGEMCLTQVLWRLTGRPTLQTCLPSITARNQYFMLTKKGELRQDNGCIEYTLDALRKMKCNNARTWNYQDSMLKHLASDLCLTRGDNSVVTVAACKKGEKKQIWTFRSPTE